MHEVYCGKIDAQRLTELEQAQIQCMPSSLVELDASEISHILKVKRHQVGDTIEVVDGEGVRFKLNITNTTPLSFQVLEVVHEVLTRRVVVVIPLLKGDRMIQAVENAVELGATDIIFWQSDRSIAKWADEKTVRKSIEKMHNLVVKSSKQSRRAYFPVILGAFNNKKLFVQLDAITDKQIVVLHESATKHIGNCGSFELADPEVVVLVVGPEGGITDGELQDFQKLRAAVCKISSNVLRSATAISAGLAVIYNLSKID
ncbi:MAG: 16S rRNA (uracil(1498)-N(3))-methyltransferase [Candidatus Ancillula trichonymphae]|nr:16S rRNA (uracil(1498)-N(3))-methyltransferase [Candidatus Ancillula trichonymphae]